jgi:ligand-binding sensor domain-containing protein
LYRFLYTCFIAFVWQAVQAQTVPSKRYTTADGLVSDRLTCMVQDEQGFLWTGSFFGLSRYDGYRFVNIALPRVQQNKYVTALAATGGAVYAGFLFGGGLMEYRQGRATAFTVPAYKGEAYNDVLTLCPHAIKGVLVCGSGNSVYHFADGVFRYLFALDSSYLNVDYRHLAMDKTGNIWVATDKGMLVYTAAGRLMPASADATFSVQPSGKGIIAVSQLNGNAVMSLVEVENGVLKTKKLGNAGAVVPVPQNNFQPDHTWLLDTSGRFISLTPDGNATSFLTKGFAADDVHFLYSDRENNLWIATHTGLVKMPNLPSGFFPFQELGDGTGNITGSDSALWINNGRYLYLIRNEEIKKIGRREVNFTGTLFYTANQLWIGNYEGGLCQVSLNKNKILSARYFPTFGKTKIKVHTITADANGGIWACGEKGIFYFQDGKPVAQFNPLLQKGQPAFIVSMVVDAKNHVIWAGDNVEGVLKIHYEFSGPVIRYQVQDYIDTSQGLSDGHIRSMLLDSKGTIWVGTRFSGVFRILENCSHIQVQNLSAEAGMRCTRVTDIKEVGNKAIWMATCNGIYQYLHDSGKWKAYTTADGLQQAEVFANYISSDEKRGWAVSETGVTVMQLSGKKELPPPLINLIRITVLGREDSSAFFKQQTITYQPDENSIGFQFAAASYTDEKKLWYKYRLEGYDEDWSTPTQSNSVNYASLPPGSYTFKVLASIDNNQWSAVPASFSFIIQKPFYKSPLFFVLILGGLVGGFYFFHTYRLQQKLKLERLRSRISADLHDDIGSTLSSISIISEGALQEKDLSTSKLMVKEISENTQLLMDKMDDIIWCVNPQNDSFQNLMLRIKKFSAILFEAKGIDYTISIDKRINDIALPMNQRQHLYLILKEAVNNLAKYSGCTYATISIHYEGGYLTMKVTDNGKGFDTGKQQTGNGLRNMKRRADMLHATLKIESIDRGTTVFLRTKIK